MTDNLEKFLQEDDYVDFMELTLSREIQNAIGHCETDEERVRVAYEAVRDQIDNVFDIDAIGSPAKASRVIRDRMGCCHAKANLLAAMLRFYKIPVGFCYQRMSVGEGLGYHLHCYNAVYLNGKWIKLDARGNRDDIKAEFSLDEPKLAFEIDEELGESDIKGIYTAMGKKLFEEHPEYLEQCFAEEKGKIDELKASIVSLTEKIEAVKNTVGKVEEVVEEKVEESL